MGAGLIMGDSSYDKLGRFRNALLLDEQKQHPSEKLRVFIHDMALEAYQF
jgi:hypothetical protein